jgi:hypothetical protein
MNRVRITKIGVNPDAEFPTAVKEEYKHGVANEKSPYVDYYVEGTLLRELEVGYGVLMQRDNRNGVSCVGMFSTSPVREIIISDFATTFKTINSIYKVEKL